MDVTPVLLLAGFIRGPNLISHLALSPCRGNDLLEVCRCRRNYNLC
jgi:hypothetical protein